MKNSKKEIEIIHIKEYYLLFDNIIKYRYIYIHFMKNIFEITL